MIYDIIIIGKGPAGLSASLYTSRGSLKTLIIGQDDSSILKASKIENYFGFSNVINGNFLINEGINQAKRLGVEIITNEVLAIDKKENFIVNTNDKIYYSKSLLIATGQPQKKLKFEGIDKFEGNGVSYCTTCDGFFYKNLKVGVIGNKDYAINESLELLNFTNDITLYTNGKKLDLSNKYQNEVSKFKVCEKEIQKLYGKFELEGLMFEDSSIEELTGVFIANDSADSVSFSKKLGVITQNNDIVVDENKMTNIEGIFAAGDCIGGFKQIATAVSDGAIAAKSIIKYVRELR